MKWTNRIGKMLSIGGVWTATTLTLGLAAAACLSRPVGQQPPTTKVNFTSTVSQQAVDKVDILFAIDNSASMGDKQKILADAVPDLINGLLKPRCVDVVEGKPNNQVADPAKSKEERYGCNAGFEPEFKPVTDMHIGIVSSSLGNFGGNVCDAANPRTNDRGRLINVKNIPLAKPSNFLSWFPQAEENNDAKRHPPPENPIRTIGGVAGTPDPNGLIENFTQLVIGTDQTGCGLEAQLESFYRFLIQPDPWDDIKLDGNNQADLGEGVDIEVLQQRADFLRPDSLVAIIMLSDEDDSSADPLAVGGQGWAFMAKEFPGSRVFRGNPKQGTTAPRGTTKCETDPGSEDCTSCGFQSLCDPAAASCQRIKQDKNCTTSGLSGQQGDGFNGYYQSGDDELNVRFHRMKERYGIDPQYPLKRYIDGLTKFKVPDRKAEHLTKTNAQGRRDIANYTSTPKCTNPLFAAKLPRDPGDELCALPRSTRSPDLVFFAVVGGVPNELLYPDGYDPNNAEKNRTTNDRWVTILGKDPGNFNYDGIDPHMIQSVAPRRGLTGSDLPRGNNGTDKIHGREWNTGKSDLQYACTFPLPTGSQRECTANDQSCDCAPDDTRNPPLCGGQTGATQVRAKAYPTIREFQVVRALGDQGIAASLCPIQLDDPTAPTYGYRPAVAAIIDRLKNALTTQCLPQRLRDNEQAAQNPLPEVPCLVLAQLAEPTDTCDRFALQPPKKEILDVFLEQQKAETGTVGDGGLDLAKLPVCVVPQVVKNRGETCKDQTDRVWCYVENDPANKKTPAGRCPQALIFSTGTSDMVGARFSLQCIQQFAAGQAASDPKP
jgi:hypothetical protein